MTAKPVAELRPISSILVGRRIRKQLRNLDALKESVQLRTMVHPIAVSPDGELIDGQRRIEVAKMLGWTHIPVVVVSSLTEAIDRFHAEAETNLCADPFTPAEGEDYQRRLLEEFERPAARERQREAGSRGKEGGRGRKKENPSAKLAEGNGTASSHQARARAAVPTGYSASTLAKVAEIREKAEEKPEEFGDLYEEVQKPGCSVETLYPVAARSIRL